MLHDNPIVYITYISHLLVQERQLYPNPAAESKVHYITEKAKKTEAVEIVSLARSMRRGVSFPEVTFAINDCTSFTALADHEPCNIIMHKLYSVVWHARVFKKLLKNKNREIVIAYHSLEDCIELCLVKRIRGFKLILELEEIYQDVVPCSKVKAYWEKKVIDCADGYILATEALSKVISPNKPYIVINGTYQAEPDRGARFDDGKIHCVYAGTFDPAKGGAAAAVGAATFLTERYHVHILGFGTEEQKERLLHQIENVQRKTKCTLTYDGLKSGEEYTQFLQKCQIGLCTQIPDAKYTETSFPSKVLVYLANGLRVLSVRIAAVEESAVGKILYYYDKQSPQEIANAIMRIPIEGNYDSRKLLNQLDKACEKDIKWLMEKVNDAIN